MFIAFCSSFHRFSFWAAVTLYVCLSVRPSACSQSLVWLGVDEVKKLLVVEHHVRNNVK